jgi:hypothetical protein
MRLTVDVFLNFLGEVRDARQDSVELGGASRFALDA